MFPTTYIYKDDFLWDSVPWFSIGFDDDMIWIIITYSLIMQCLSSHWDLSSNLMSLTIFFSDMIILIDCQKGMTYCVPRGVVPSRNCHIYEWTHDSESLINDDFICIAWWSFILPFGICCDTLSLRVSVSTVMRLHHILSPFGSTSTSREILGSLYMHNQRIVMVT